MGSTAHPVRASVAKIDRVRMETFKSMLHYFNGLTPSQGDLFVSAFAMWTCGVATGPVGGFSNLPVIIAGNPGGQLKQSQYLDLDPFMNASLLKALIETCGVDSSNFATAESAAPLDAILS